MGATLHFSLQLIIRPQPIPILCFLENEKAYRYRHFGVDAVCSNLPVNDSDVLCSFFREGV